MVFQGRVVRKANGSGSREVVAADKKIERTQDIHQLYSASQTFQIFEPLNIDILPKAYSWQKEYSKSTTVERQRETKKQARKARRCDSMTPETITGVTDKRC